MLSRARTQKTPSEARSCSCYIWGVFRCWALCVSVLRLAPALCQMPSQPVAEEPVAHFGTTVIISNGLRGDIYFIPEESQQLPKFEKLTPVGSVYTDELNVPRTYFTQGFPGVTNRFAWFAIDYRGKFWIDNPGKYTWALMSDDGSKLYIDGHLVINNDGQHPSRGIAGSDKLKRGAHTIRVSYFQGPPTEVSLILAVIPPGDDDFSVFNITDYLSPEALAEWKKSRPDDPRFSGGPKPRRKPGAELVLDRTMQPPEFLRPPGIR